MKKAAFFVFNTLQCKQTTAMHNFASNKYGKDVGLKS